MFAEGAVDVLFAPAVGSEEADEGSLRYSGGEGFGKECLEGIVGLDWLRHGGSPLSGG